MAVLRSHLDPASDECRANHAAMEALVAELLDAAKKPVLGAWVLRDAVLASTLAADIKKRLRLPPSLRYRYERADVLLFLAAGVVPIALDLPVAPFVLQRLELHDLAGQLGRSRTEGDLAIEGEVHGEER